MTSAALRRGVSEPLHGVGVRLGGAGLKRGAPSPDGDAPADDELYIRSGFGMRGNGRLSLNCAVIKSRSPLDITPGNNQDLLILRAATRATFRCEIGGGESRFSPNRRSCRTLRMRPQRRDDASS